MTRSEVIARLIEHRSEVAALHATSLTLFGSVARDEARADSDVDLLVEFDKPVGLFEFLELKERLEEILGRRVDLATRASLKPRIREKVLAEAIRAT
jgi:predicted nucleotidyltransferase